jgi:hypothetical protein
MKMHFLSVAALAAFVLAPVAANAAPQDFDLTNSTGYEINAVYIGPHGDPSWGEDILGQDTLEDGGSVHIHFPHGRGETCDWDLKVTYTSDGSSAQWVEGFDLCTISSIDIKWDGHNTSATYQ